MLDSPVISLGPEGGWLTFDSWNYVECSWDGWNLQISFDGGDSWSMLEPVEGYDQGEPYGTCPCMLGGDSNCGYGEFETWNVDLTEYPDTDIRIKIAFTSDSSVAYTGLIIDNVCIAGGSHPSLVPQSQLLNPDTDGDGVRDVHIGDYIYYRATFTNMTPDSTDYGVEHIVNITSCCPGSWEQIASRGPACRGTLAPYEEATHFYRVLVPERQFLLDLNPFTVEIVAWICNNDPLLTGSGRSYFDVILLPAWEPPPFPDEGLDFYFEEIECPLESEL